MGLIKKLNKKKTTDTIVCTCIPFSLKINAYTSMLAFDGHTVCFRSIIMHYQ